MRIRLLLAAPVAAIALITGLISPALARGTDGTLHVVFAQHTSDTDSILHVPVSPSGAVGARSTVVSGWSGLPSDPKIGLDPVRGYHVFFPGMQDTNSTNPWSQGFISTAPTPRPAPAGRWTAPPTRRCSTARGV